MILQTIKLRLRNRLRISPGNQIEVAPGAKLRHCHIVVRGRGNRLKIADSANLRGVLLELRGEENELHIGADTVIGEGCYLSARGTRTRLEIGSDGMLSRNVRVMTGDGHDIHHQGRLINPPGSIRVGDHVWFADGATILKGVSLGDGAVVGLGSVVTQDVPPATIAAGNPARIIRQEIHWTR
ncbi:acyltransferase [Halomonas sp. 328]|uniref:acyltransferase n=1 Tax=Halomonas sp. 328 TaxID=2776704 RepID=UPI002DDC1E56|nr:acyltransferase [Halomonas sp. 328]